MEYEFYLITYSNHVSCVQKTNRMWYFAILILGIGKKKKNEFYALKLYV